MTERRQAVSDEGGVVGWVAMEWDACETCKWGILEGGCKCPTFTEDSIQFTGTTEETIVCYGYKKETP
jgi:hypothetical protein